MLCPQGVAAKDDIGCCTGSQHATSISHTLLPESHPVIGIINFFGVCLAKVCLIKMVRGILWAFLGSQLIFTCPLALRCLLYHKH